MVKTGYFLLLIFLLQQCRFGKEENKNAPSADNKTKPASDTIPPNANASFLNGITVRTNGGLLISSGYLTDKDGNLIPPQNTIQPGEAVYLNLAIQTGWATTNGNIAPGASQVITTDKGESVVETGDLFAASPSVPEREGKQLQLRTLITKSRRDIRFFTVRFRVWDKNGSGEVQGSYRLFPTSNGL